VVASWRAEDSVYIRKENVMGLYQGKNYGVFTGRNGCYVKRIVGDGISRYEALSGGEGWSDEV
jgi:hypothetical protein